MRRPMSAVFSMSDRDIPGANAESRFTAGIRCFHDAAAAGGKNGGGALVAHELVGCFNGRGVNALDDATGAPACSAADEDGGCFTGAAFRAGVRAEDNPVARL